MRDRVVDKHREPHGRGEPRIDENLSDVLDVSFDHRIRLRVDFAQTREKGEGPATAEMQTYLAAAVSGVMPRCTPVWPPTVCGSPVDMRSQPGWPPRGFRRDRARTDHPVGN
jgi:hypothetical protein